jgi:polyhydroxybutyrate depolymerase
MPIAPRWVFPSAVALVLVVAWAASACGSDAGDDGSGAASGEGGAGPGSGNESGSSDPDGGGGPGSGDGAAGSDGSPIAASCSGKTGKVGDRTVMITVDGKQRSFDLHVPPGYDATKATPLVFLFHGYTMTPAQIESATHFAATADARGLIVAFPTGIGQSFNAGDCCGQAVTDMVDDVSFTRAMITSIGGEYCVDAKRTFSAGFSNGGFFSYYLACELSDQIAAVAAVSGGLRIDASACKPKRPVPLLHVHGTNDVVVPFNGGGLGNAKPVSTSVDAFKTIDGCPAGAGTVVYTKDDVSCTSWGPCMAKSDVELCTVTGGGHQWPGGDELPYGPALSTNLDTSKTVADFFLAHPMP